MLVGRCVSGGIGVFVDVGVNEVVGVSVGVGVSVMGRGVFVDVADSAATFCMTDHVCSAKVSAGIGMLDCSIVEMPHAISIKNAKIESKTRRR